MIYDRVFPPERKRKALVTIELASAYIITAPEELKNKYHVEQEYSWLIHAPTGRVCIEICLHNHHQDFAFAASDAATYNAWIADLKSTMTHVEKLFFANVGEFLNVRHRQLPYTNHQLRDSLQKVGWVDVKLPKDIALARRCV